MRFFSRHLAPGLLAVLLTLAGAGISHADEALRRVQQSLRDQGFYYGSIDGAPGDETTQAIRRYQIRNGLAVTGQINDETRNSIARTGAANGGSSSTANRGANAPARPPSASASADARAAQSTPPPLRAPPPPSNSRSVPAPTPVPRERVTPSDEPDYRIAPRPPSSQAAPLQPPNGTGRGPAREEDDDDEDAAPAPPAGAPAYRGSQGRPDLRAYPPQDRPDNGAYPPARGPYGSAPSPALTALFEETPYEFAPPAVQADILRRAQERLLRSGFFEGEANGLPGRRTAEAIANFQEVNRLRATARLDVSTLAALRLLPARPTVEPRYDRPRRPGVIFEGRIVQ